MITEKQAREFYSAVLKHQVRADGTFYVGSQSTHTFCQPSCSEFKAKFEDCAFFLKPREAVYQGFKPCEHCNPLQQLHLSDCIYELVDSIEANPDKMWKTYELKTNYDAAWKAQDQFQEAIDMTYIEYARARRMGLAMRYIRTNDETCAGSLDAFSDFMDPVADPQSSLIIAWIETPIQPMVAIADNTHLYLLQFIDRRALETTIRNLRQKLQASLIPGKNSITEQIQHELSEYFAETRIAFKTPLAFDVMGSDFQKKSWSALRAIPIGETKSYEQVAREIGEPDAGKRVRQANGDNPWALVVPCHRAIAANGSLAGYGGGIERKQSLLDMEKRMAKKSVVDISARKKEKISGKTKFFEPPTSKSAPSLVAKRSLTTQPQKSGDETKRPRLTCLSEKRA